MAKVLIWLASGDRGNGQLVVYVLNDTDPAMIFALNRHGELHVGSQAFYRAGRKRTLRQRVLL